MNNHWTRSLDGRAEFLSAAESEIQREAKRMACRYGCKNESEDIASELQVALFEAMNATELPQEFMFETPQEAAVHCRQSFLFRERARNLAKKRQRRTRASKIGDVMATKPSADTTTKLAEITDELFSLLDKEHRLSQSDQAILAKRIARSAWPNAISPDLENKLAQNAGVSVEKQHEMHAEYAKVETLEDKDRQAESRVVKKLVTHFAKMMPSIFFMVCIAVFSGTRSQSMLKDDPHQRPNQKICEEHQRSILKIAKVA